MNISERRSYNSPLREAKAQETREKILESVAAWLQTGSLKPLTLDTIASYAGIQKRTVLRHFQTKEALLTAFWLWINERTSPPKLPTSIAELIEAPRDTFKRFDEQEGVIRASLHTPAGREMRLSVLPARREAFSSALRETTQHASEEVQTWLEAVAHLLYSAAAWETMRDYAGISGTEAGEAASWALQILIDSVRSSNSCTNHHSEGENTMTPTLEITRPERAESLWVMSDHIRFMGEVDGTDLAVLEVEVPPGSGTPPHQHESPEIFRVLSGEITFGTVVHGSFTASSEGPGSVVTVPSQVPHNYQNNSNTVASMLVVVEKSMVEFFQEVGRQQEPAGGPPSEAQIAEIMAACARHGITMLGGPPA